MVRVRINNMSYTLMSIVSETIQVDKAVFGIKDVVVAMAYVYDKERKVYKFLAEQITEVEK